MAKRRKRKNDLIDIVGVGATAPILLAGGTGISRQIQGAASNPGTALAAVPGVVGTGISLAVGTAFINKAIEKAKKGSRNLR